MSKIYKFIIGVTFTSCLILSTALLKAATISGDPPTLYINEITITFPVIGEITIDGADLSDLQDGLNAEISTEFNNSINDANDEIGQYKDQDDLAMGFANASVYASQVATHQGYQDYSLFAITTGIMLGVQAPSIDPDYYDPDTIEEELEEEGDLYAGIGVGLCMVNLGINTWFLYPGLYLNVKFGYLSLEHGGVSFKTTLLGVGANYSWIKTKSFLLGLFKWRGISFGTGLIYNRSEIEFEQEVTIDPVPFSYEHDFTEGAFTETVTFTGNVYLDPSFQIGLETNTFTIPFDVTTSVRLLWVMNFNLGAGMDINFGSTDINLKAAGVARLEDVSMEGGEVDSTTTPANLNVDGSTTGVNPSIVRARIMTGIGFNILPVKIDIPIIYYFNSGASVGVTVGVVW